MAENMSGLAVRWSTVAPQMMSLHCIVHQTDAQCRLCGELKTHGGNNIIPRQQQAKKGRNTFEAHIGQLYGRCLLSE